MNVVTVSVPLKWTAEVRGDTKAVMRVLRKADVPRMYDHKSPGGACWTVPAARVSDVLAAGEVLRGVSVQLLYEQEALL